MSEPLFVNERLVIPADELGWRAVHASGPGGQNVNKVATKVELRFDAAHSRVLDGGTRARLLALAAGRRDAEGAILIVCQEARTQRRNLELARERLAELVRQASIPPKHRRATRPTRSSQRRRLESKARRAATKRQRRAPDDA